MIMKVLLTLSKWESNAEIAKYPGISCKGVWFILCCANCQTFLSTHKYIVNILHSSNYFVLIDILFTGYSYTSMLVCLSQAVVYDDVYILFLLKCHYAIHLTYPQIHLNSFLILSVPQIDTNYFDNLYNLFLYKVDLKYQYFSRTGKYSWVFTYYVMVLYLFYCSPLYHWVQTFFTLLAGFLCSDICFSGSLI